ncbi:MAG: hypothetical protein FJX69_16970 [Alphaproteobacteria bacterium]|nr:hypothetical protein [Alphaproteobacteria bacterium]
MQRARGMLAAATGRAVAAAGKAQASRDAREAYLDLEAAAARVGRARDDAPAIGRDLDDLDPALALDRCAARGGEMAEGASYLFGAGWRQALFGQGVRSDAKD